MRWPLPIRVAMRDIAAYRLLSRYLVDMGELPAGLESLAMLRERYKVALVADAKRKAIARGEPWDDAEGA